MAIIFHLSLLTSLNHTLAHFSGRSVRASLTTGRYDRALGGGGAAELRSHPPPPRKSCSRTPMKSIYLNDHKIIIFLPRNIVVLEMLPCRVHRSIQHNFGFMLSYLWGTVNKRNLPCGYIEELEGTKRCAKQIDGWVGGGGCRGDCTHHYPSKFVGECIVLP